MLDLPLFDNSAEEFPTEDVSYRECHHGHNVLDIQIDGEWKCTCEDFNRRVSDKRYSHEPLVSQDITADITLV